jgi:hypothetical protein
VITRRDAGESEIQELDALLGHQDVGGLEIAVRDPFAMRRVERAQDLPGVLDRLVHRQRTLQRRAFDVLHHQVVRPYVVELADVWMIQRRNRPSLAREALAELGFGGLDGDDAVEPGVASLPHLSHAPRADLREDLVGPEFCAGRERHTRIELSLADRCAGANGRQDLVGSEAGPNG